MQFGQYQDAAVIALGGNLPGAFGSSVDLLDAAVEALAQEGLEVLARSVWWGSSAWPDPSAPDFVNGVILAHTALPPETLLQRLRAVEQTFGRRAAARNAPRTLDLDLIALGETVMDNPDLILPHPRAHERLFVMGPLAQIAPEWRHPVSGLTAAALAAQAAIGRDAAPL